MRLLENIAIRYPKIFCKGITRIITPGKTLYLSFDDGPNPKVTENILKLLDKYNAKASFFCKGSNAIMYPDLLEKIKIAGHTIGNHSFSHLDAFKVSNRKWLIDALRKSPVSETFFFRPPYGRIYPWQCWRIKKDYKIVLWDVLTYDYHKKYSKSRIKKIILKNTRNGSILVFHDNLFSAPKMLSVLEFTLTYYSKLGYRFEKI
ncbi:MAG: polysaccharide deacetylase family protein [Bacteroidales bacterium]|nr:polysaccharide deacetylase family protein [Bacteroidales bacterium]